MRRTGITLPTLDLPKVSRKIEDFLRQKVEEAGAEGVVLGLSGGVDSSTTAYLCARALGPEKVLALVLPDKQVTPKEDLDNAELVANKLRIRREVVEIYPVYREIENIHPFFQPADTVARGNVKARVRMILLYYAANMLKRLVVGTGDRSEVMVGYYTKHGDGGVDLLPLGGLFKTQVRELAKYLGVPPSIIARPSSPRLWLGQTAEGELGISYDLLDLLLYGLVDLKMGKRALAEEVGCSVATVEKVAEMIRRSEHKREMPPIAQI